MTNDTPVYHAFDVDGRWMGMGTREAIQRRGFQDDGIVHWCAHQWLVDGWRPISPVERSSGA